MPGVDEMSRIAGQLEAGLKALEKQLETMTDKLTSIDTRLSHIEAKENERKGVWKAAAAFGSLCGAAGAAAMKLLMVAGGMIR